MIIWFSLAVASLIFGGRVDGSPHVLHKYQEPLSFQTNFTQSPLVFVNSTSQVHYTISTKESIPALSVILCQTSAGAGGTIDSTNAFQIAQLFSNICVNGLEQQSCPAKVNSVDANKEVTLTFNLTPGNGFDPQNLSNFFLCFGQSTPSPPVCDSYSPVFDLMDPSVSQTSSAPAQVPNVFASSSLSITRTNAALSVATSAVSNEVGSATISPPSASTSWLTESQTPTATTFITVTPTPTSSSEANGASVTSHSKKGLSTGALVGIIVGAVGGLLALALLALLCLRGRKRTRAARSNTFDSNASAPEHVLLTQPYHSVSSSRDLINEKTSPTTLASILETPLSRPVLPQNPRHSYDSLNASAPYSGLAAAPPKRKQASPTPPVAQNVQPHSQSLLSRELSDGSGPLTRGLSDASGPISPRSIVRGEGEEFEEYHDVPIYGDARHTPTVYQSHPSLQAPFLSEEGMSAEEIARLEEEERRIDAAIAAAEAEDGGRRSR